MILLGVEERVQMYYFFYILGIIADINVIKAVVNIKPIYQIGGGNCMVFNMLQQAVHICV